MGIVPMQKELMVVVGEDEEKAVRSANDYLLYALCPDQLNHVHH